MANYIGIETGGTKIQVVFGSGAGEIFQCFRFNVNKENGAGGILSQIEEAINKIMSEHQPEAVGMGFGGPIDFRSGRVARSFHVSGWDGFSLSEWLEKKTGLPAIVDNDANVAAIGEAMAGAGRGIGRVFYTTLGSGMGGGLVVDGRIYHGAVPGESEIGLMCYDMSGASMESRCCGWATDKKIREEIARCPNGILASLVPSGQIGGETRWLAEAVEKGDVRAMVLLDETARDIAFAFSHAIHLFSPEILVIGGGLSLVGEPLRKRIEKFLPEFVNSVFHPCPPIKLTELGEKTVIVGALFLAAGKGAASRPGRD